MTHFGINDVVEHNWSKFTWLLFKTIKKGDGERCLTVYPPGGGEVCVILQMSSLIAFNCYHENALRLSQVLAYGKTTLYR